MQVYINNKEAPAFSCIHANLNFPQAHTRMTLQVVSCSILGSATAHSEARHGGSTSVQAAATSTHLLDLLLSAAQNLAKHCHTSNVGTGCKLMPYFLDPPFLPSSPFLFITPENRVHSPKSKSRRAPFCKVWAPQISRFPMSQISLLYR